MKRWIKYLLVFLVLAVPLVFNPAYIDGYNLPKITLFYLVTIILFAFWIIPQFDGGKITIKIPPFFYAALAWVLANVIAAVFSMNPSQSFWGQYSFYSYGLLPLITAFVFSILVCQFEAESSVLSWVALGALLSTVYGFVEYIPGVRMNTTFGSPIYYSAYAAALLPVVLSKYLEGRNRWWLVSALVFTAGLLLAGSRGAFVAVAVSITVFYFTAFSKKQLKYKDILPVIAGLFLIGLYLAFYPASSNKFKTAFDRTESSNFSRYLGWKAGIEIVKERPLLGAGPANFLLAFRRHKTVEYVRSVGEGLAQGHAHNDVIQAAATTGLIGLAAYAFFWLTLLLSGHSNTDEGLFETGIFAGITAVFTFNLFNNGMVPELMLFWLFAGWVGGRSKGLRSYELSVPKGNFVPLAVAIASLFLVNLTLKPFRAEMKIVDGNVAAVSGNMGAAFSDFEEAVKIHPGVAGYYKTLLEAGRVMIVQTTNAAERKNVLDKMQKYAEENAAINRFDPDARYNLGSVYVWRFQLLGEDFREKAARSFLECVNLDKYSLAGLSGLAKISILLGRPEQAKELYKRVLEIDPINAEALKNIQ